MENTYLTDGFHTEYFKNPHKSIIKQPILKEKIIGTGTL